jgi:hypothetical protein
MHTLFWLENLKGRVRPADLEVDGNVILDWMLGKYGGEVWTECVWLRIWTGDGLFEHGNKPSGSIIYGEFLD